MTRILLVLTIVFSLLMFVDANAQSKTKLPSDDYGLGIALGAVGNLGGEFVYALEEGIHIGTFLGFSYDTGTELTSSKTFMYFSPFAKFFVLEPIRHFRPFILAQFVVSTQSESFKDKYDVESTRTVTFTGMYGSVGAQWFPYSSIGVYAGIVIVKMDFDPFKGVFGIGDAFIGIEWYLD